MDISGWFLHRRAQFLGLLRIASGLLLLLHGAQRVFKLPIPFPAPQSLLLLAAGPAELVTGVCITLGFATLTGALVGVILSAEMAIGYFLIELPNGVWFALSASEAPFLSCLIFLYFLAAGPGAWSVDGARLRNAQIR